MTSASFLPVSSSDVSFKNNGGSKWNYLVPGIAATSWTICLLGGVFYGGYTAHNYAYPNNQINPHLMDVTLDIIKTTAIIAASTIPAALAWTSTRAVTQCTTNGVREVFQKSLGWPGPKELVITNTLVAPFASIALTCYVTCKALADGE